MNVYEVFGLIVGIPFGLFCRFVDKVKRVRWCSNPKVREQDLKLQRWIKENIKKG